MGWIKLNDTNIVVELIFLNSHVQKKTIEYINSKEENDWLGVVDLLGELTCFNLYFFK
jgi:hypothetical protein